MGNNFKQWKLVKPTDAFAQLSVEDQERLVNYLLTLLSTELNER